MKPIAVFADLHAGKTDLGRWRQQWSEALEVAVQRGCRHAVIAGDVFDKDDACVYMPHRHWSTGDVYEAVMEPMQDSRMDFLIIRGNHDQASGCPLDALHPFGYHHRWRVVRQPLWRMFADVNFLCIPWQWDREFSAQDCIAEMMNKPIPTEHTALLAHLQVRGAKLNALKTHDGTGGMSVDREFLETLKVDRFLLGDFHRRQDLFAGRGGYIGALCQNDFGERGNPTGFEIWTPGVGAEWVDVNESPCYTQIECRADQLSYLDAVNARALGPVKIIITGGEVDGGLAASIERLGVVIIRKVLQIERARRVEEIPDGVLNDPTALIRLYAASLEPKPTTVEIDRLCAAHKASGTTADNQPQERDEQPQARPAAPFDHIALDGAVTPDFLGVIE